MPTLFVSMPFGLKPVPQLPEAFDFDKVYKQLIRPAGEKAGWKVTRIDEITDLGPIGDQYLRELYRADLVLSDISMANANVYYELGIRHAIASGGTILIALTGARIPFDLANHRVIFYESDPDSWEDAREKIAAALKGVTRDVNPIRDFLVKIAATASPAQDPAAFERDFRGRIDRARNLDQLISVWMWVRNLSPIPVPPLMSLADRLAELEEWTVAADALRSGLSYAPNDFEIYRKLGWCLQFAGPGFERECSEAFEQALRLNPNDPETLGMIGGRAKRLGRYTEAADYYARGARVSPNSLYMLVNEAALRLLSDPTKPEPGIELYRKLLRRAEKLGAAADEWTELVIAEAHFALGDSEPASQHYLAARNVATSQKSIRSAVRQLELFASVNFRPEDARRLAALLQNEPQAGLETTTTSVLIDLPGVNLTGRAAAVAASVSDRADTPAASGVAATPVLIHLSDIHFGNIVKDGVKKPMHRFYDGENSQPLVKHLEDEFARIGCHFKYGSERLHLVVSGDLVYNGSEQEYEEALKFLVDATAALRIERQNVHVIPGNHDISWNLAKQDKKYRFDPYLTCLETFYGTDLFKKKYPLITTLSLTKRPAAHEILAVSYYPESNLLIAGLNSCVFETEQHHYGFVGERQLKNLRQLISDLKVSPETTRVALVHHHLHPFPESLQDREGEGIWVDVSTVRDAGLVERSLERLGFDVVLHGHKHKAQLRETLVQESDPSKGQLRRLIVCGAGTVSCVELESNVPNHYEVIELRTTCRTVGTEFLRAEWRVLPVEAGAEWTTVKAWTILG